MTVADGNAPQALVAEIRERTADYVEAMIVAPHALRGQQLRGGGPVADFEMALAARCGFPYCLATSNATTALLVAALAADLPSKQIIVPPNSWEGTFGPFEFVGATLLEAESDGCGNICPKSVARMANESTAAVIATDWQGARHASEEIRAICDKVGCLYIEDTSRMPTASGRTEDRSLADIQVISFGPGKPMCLGEGGALMTRHSSIYERAVALSQHPERTLAERVTPLPQRLFLNARMHPLAALIGNVLLETTSSPSQSSHTTEARPCS